MPTQEASEKVASLMLQLGNVMQTQLGAFGSSLLQLSASCEQEPEQTALALAALGLDMQRLAETLGDTLKEVGRIQEPVPVLLPLPPMLQ